MTAEGTHEVTSTREPSGGSDAAGALVFGGGSGMGRAVTRALLRDGLLVAALDIDENAAAEAVRDTPGIAVACDATSEASVARAVEQAVAALPPIRALVSVVGGSAKWFGRMEEMSLEAWNDVLALNLTSLFLAVRAGVPHMHRAGGGSIVAFSSGSGRAGYPIGFGAYAATKAGVSGYVRAWHGSSHPTTSG